MADERPVGIFDSGIGGLTVTSTIMRALPAERLLYFGDNRHVPYGSKPAGEILALGRGVTRALVAAGCKLVVIACNTASGAALTTLRTEFPEVPFVGMEPAVKPAVEQTRTGVVGVLATVYTAHGDVLNTVVERFAHDVEVIVQPCPGLVGRIEAGEFDTPTTRAMLHGWIDPMRARGIDALVLGCTHYPIIRKVIQEIAGPGVRVIEPSEAVARRVAQVLRANDALAPAHAPGGLACFTSGDVAAFTAMMARLGIVGTGPVRPGTWRDGVLELG
ncbi:MAG: glutamate racemase [Flavobacteriales bacterium]|nr:glutamate racemase [Flavobacteriales bacterium]